MNLRKMCNFGHILCNHFEFSSNKILQDNCSNKFYFRNSNNTHFCINCSYLLKVQNIESKPYDNENNYLKWNLQKIPKKFKITLIIYINTIGQIDRHFQFSVKNSPELQLVQLFSLIEHVLQV